MIRKINTVKHIAMAMNVLFFLDNKRLLTHAIITPSLIFSDLLLINFYKILEVSNFPAIQTYGETAYF